MDYIPQGFFHLKKKFFKRQPWKQILCAVLQRTAALFEGLPFRFGIDSLAAAAFPQYAESVRAVPQSIRRQWWHRFLAAASEAFLPFVPVRSYQQCDRCRFPPAIQRHLLPHPANQPAVPSGRASLKRRPYHQIHPVQWHSSVLLFACCERHRSPLRWRE